MSRETMCVVSLFGPFRIKANGAFCSFRISGTTRELLAYLLSRAGEATRRDVLMGLFWPESDVERARSSLNTALWRVKKAIAGLDGVTLSSFDDLVAMEVSDHVVIDAVALERRTAAARIALNDVGSLDVMQRRSLAASVRACSGAFFEGVDAHWAMVERERMGNVHMRALGLLMREAEDAGRIEDALTWGQDILAIDPLRETVHLRMMQLFLRMGERGRAIRQFDALRDVLEDELGVEPDDEAAALRASIAEARPRTAQMHVVAELAG